MNEENLNCNPNSQNATILFNPNISFNFNISFNPIYKMSRIQSFQTSYGLQKDFNYTHLLTQISALLSSCVLAEQVLLKQEINHKSDVEQNEKKKKLYFEDFNQVRWELDYQEYELL